jgi:hypothetical protein
MPDAGAPPAFRGARELLLQMDLQSLAARRTGPEVSEHWYFGSVSDHVAIPIGSGAIRQCRPLPRR